MATDPQSPIRRGKYQMVRILGTGAHSTIWLVRDVRAGLTCALKRIIKHRHNDRRFFRQAIIEYEIGRQIDHPNVRKMYALRRIRRLWSVKELHLLMEYCPGATVQELRPSSVLTACGVFAQVAHALQKINECGFVHGDMKPGNIIVDENGNVKIIDLGHACSIGTIKQRVQGSPDYIAPEQIQLGPLDARTDVFNFGASFYWALTGRTPPSLLPQAGAPGLVNRGNVSAPHEINPSVPPLLSRLVMDCIQIRPADRPQSMQEVVSRLGVILHKEWTSPVPT